MTRKNKMLLKKLWCYLFGHSFSVTWISPDWKLHGIGSCQRCKIKAEEIKNKIN